MSSSISLNDQEKVFFLDDGKLREELEGLIVSSFAVGNLIDITNRDINYYKEQYNKSIEINKAIKDEIKRAKEDEKILNKVINSVTNAVDYVVGVVTLIKDVVVTTYQAFANADYSSIGKFFKSMYNGLIKELVKLGLERLVDEFLYFFEQLDLTLGIVAQTLDGIGLGKLGIYISRIGDLLVTVVNAMCSTTVVAVVKVASPIVGGIIGGVVGGVSSGGAGITAGAGVGVAKGKAFAEFYDLACMGAVPLANILEQRLQTIEDEIKGKEVKDLNTYKKEVEHIKSFSKSKLDSLSLELEALEDSKKFINASMQIGISLSAYLSVMVNEYPMTSEEDLFDMFLSDVGYRFLIENKNHLSRLELNYIIYLIRIGVEEYRRKIPKRCFISGELIKEVSMATDIPTNRVCVELSTSQIKEISNKLIEVSNPISRYLEYNDINEFLKNNITLITQKMKAIKDLKSQHPEIFKNLNDRNNLKFMKTFLKENENIVTSTILKGQSFKGNSSNFTSMLLVALLGVGLGFGFFKYKRSKSIV